MKAITKEINKTQLFFLLIALGSIFKILYLPVVLIKASGRDGWITVILMLLCDIFIALMIFIVYNLQKEKIMKEIFDKTLGKIISSIVLIIVGLFFVFKLYFVFSNTLKYIVSALYSNLPWNPFLIPLLLITIFAAYKGIKAIARTNQLFAYIGIFIIALSVIMFLANTDFSALLPVAESGIAKPIKGLWRFMAGTGDYTVCLLFLGRIKAEKGVNFAFISGVLLSSIFCVCFSLAFCAFYGNIGSSPEYGLILYDMAKSFKGNDTFSRFDVPMIIFWLIAALFNLFIRYWAAGQCFFDVLPLQKNQKNTFITHLPASVGIMVLYFIIYLVPKSKIIIEHCSLIITLILNFAVPLLLLISSIILKHKENKNERAQASQIANAGNI